MWGKPREVRTSRHTSRTLFFAGRGIVTGSQGHACSQHLDSKYLYSHCDRVSILDAVTAVGREHTKPLPALGATSGDKADTYHGGRESVLRKWMLGAQRPLCLLLRRVELGKECLGRGAPSTSQWSVLWKSKRKSK